MIVTLTPNPAVDVTLTVAEVDRGGSRVIDTARRRAGGKGVNVSRVLAQQGEPTHAVLPIGRADERWFDRDLAGVPHTLVPCEAATRHSYALVEMAPGVTSVLNEAGASRSAAEWQAALAVVRDHLGAAEVLVASGSLPPATPPTLLGVIAAAGHAAGVPVVLDVSGSHLVAAAEAGADVLKPNRAELAAAFPGLDAVDGARALQERGARLVVVSLGAAGMLLVPPTGPALHARLPAALQGNPTGAGDAAVAALAGSLRGRDVTALTEADLETLARRAVAWSAAAVLSPWAGSLGTDPAPLEQEVLLAVPAN